MNYFDTKEYKNAVAIIKKQYAHLWDLFNTYCEKVAIYNDVKTDFFEAKSTAYAKASVLVDDL